MKTVELKNKEQITETRHFHFCLEIKRKKGFTAKYNKRIHALGGLSFLETNRGGAKKRHVDLFMPSEREIDTNKESAVRARKVLALAFEIVSDPNFELCQKNTFAVRTMFNAPGSAMLTFSKSQPLTKDCFAYVYMDFQDLARWGVFDFAYKNTLIN